MADLNEPKKETVRITLPPRTTNRPTVPVEKETARINLPNRPPAPPPGAKPPGPVVRPPSAGAVRPPPPSIAPKPLPPPRGRSSARPPAPPAVRLGRRLRPERFARRAAPPAPSFKPPTPPAANRRKTSRAATSAGRKNHPPRQCRRRRTSRSPPPPLAKAPLSPLPGATPRDPAALLPKGLVPPPPPAGLKPPPPPAPAAPAPPKPVFPPANPLASRSVAPSGPRKETARIADSPMKATHETGRATRQRAFGSFDPVCAAGASCQSSCRKA